MHTRNVPQSGAFYWLALSLASVFGANLGDLVSHNLHLGHIYGLPPLLLALWAVLRLEGRTRLSSQAFYWVAILLLRTMATNIGDLTTHDLKIDPPVAMAGLALVMLGLQGIDNLRRPQREQNLAYARQTGLPRTSGFFWSTMLAAGALGTVAGDYVADDLGLGLVNGTLLLTLGLIVLLLPRLLTGAAHPAYYWLCVVAVRTAGTTAGDLLASRHGLKLGLPLACLLSGSVFLIAFLLRPRRAVATA